MRGASTARPSKIVPRPGDVSPRASDVKACAATNHRDRGLLDLAHGLHECQMQLPGVCVGYELAGCEPAHSNSGRHGKGRSLKAHDCFHAAACHACHSEFDQGHRFSKEEKAEFMQRAIERTALEYWKRGWVAVTEKGRKHKG